MTFVSYKNLPRSSFVHLTVNENAPDTNYIHAFVIKPSIYPHLPQIIQIPFMFSLSPGSSIEDVLYMSLAVTSVIFDLFLLILKYFLVELGLLDPTRQGFYNV